MQSKPFHQQRGVVIIIALFIVALVATMAYVMMDRLSRDTDRTALLIRYVKAENEAQGSLAWAMDALRQDWETQQPNQLVDRMPMRSPVNTVNGYSVSSTIEDMQGRFNLNNLINADAQTAFKQMLKALVPSVGPDQATNLVHAIVDWITPSPGLTEFNQYYLGLNQPYRAAHRQMISPSELLLVKGMTTSIYKALLPYVTALPEVTSLNVLTAPAADLLTLSPTLTLPAAEAIVEARKSAQPLTMESFSALPSVSALKLSEANLTVASSYFLVTTDVLIEKQHLLIYTLLQRSMIKDKLTISILWQSIGAW